MGIVNRCSCEGDNIDRLLQPHVLIILKKENLTGYAIYKELVKYPMFIQAKPDLTGFYRQLSHMEERGNIEVKEVRRKASSTVKVYGLTTEGEACLENWRRTLENYSNSIGFLLGEMYSNL